MCALVWVVLMMGGSIIIERRGMAAPHAPLLVVVMARSGRAISSHQRHQIVSEVMVGVISPAACARRELAKVCGGGGHRESLCAEQIVHYASPGPALARIPVVLVGVLVVVGVAWRRGVGGWQMESLHAHLGLVRRRRGIVEIGRAHV